MKTNRWNLSAVIACAGIFGSGLAAYGADNYALWTYSCTINLNTKASGANVATPQTGFPVLIRLTSANTAFSFAQAQAAGRDIRFASSGGTHLPYQIEHWDQGGQDAEIWVKTDVNGNDSTQFITMYWGNGTAVDSSNGAAVFNNEFAGVWHLNDGGTGARVDATANGFNAAAVNYLGTESKAGIIAKCDSLPGGTGIPDDNGTNRQYMRVSSDMADFSTSGITYSVWAYPTTAAGQTRLMDLCSDTTGASENWQATNNIIFSGNGTGLYAEVYGASTVSGGAITAAGAFAANQWQHFAFTVNGTAVTVYKNGAQVAAGVSTQTIPAATRTWNLFGRSAWTGDPYFQGRYDEMELSNTPRSADWIKLTYESQKAGSAWLSFSSVTISVPTITSNPSNTTVNAGQSATFTVGASGGGLSYQWQRSPDGTTWSNAPGASTSSSYSFSTVYPGDNNAQFRCYVSNTKGNATSNSATLTVTCNPPTISSQPSNQSVAPGDTARFSVTASGAGLTYQWERSNDGGVTWGSVSVGIGGTTASYKFAVVSGDNNAKFRCQVVSSMCGNNTTSSVATLTVSSCPPPAITQEPTPLTANVISGNTISRTNLQATGSGVLSYQWQFSANGGSIWNNATMGASFTSDPLIANSQFRCIVYNACGYDTSQVISVTVCTPPAFSQQPKSWAGIAGSTDTFSIALISGVTNPHYQWQRNDVPTPGTWGIVPAGNGSGTTGVYTFTAQVADNNIQFRCVVTGDCGTVTSNQCTSFVCSPATIATNPKDSDVTSGTPVSFTVVAAGGGPYSYQWQSSPDGTTFGNITGATLQTLSFPSADPAQNGYRYRCQVTNGCGTNPATSAAATLTVCAPAKVFAQPGNTGVNVGGTATFTVTGTGSAPLNYQWLRSNGASWLPVTTGTGGTTATYQLVTVPTDNGAQFRVVVYNSCGRDTSGAVSLTVCLPPIITRQPVDVNTNPGVADTFTTGATGTSIVYQWQRSDSLGQVWTPIQNATAASYVITPAITDNGAEFRCSITSQCGDTMSRVAMLTVCIPVKVTQQNIGPDSVLVGQNVHFGMTAQGTNVVFQWQKSSDGTTFTPIAGATLDTLSFAAATTDSGTTFRCIVSGKCGTQVTGNPGLVRVFVPVHAAFGVSPASGLVPLAATFTDSSTGSFTKRTWDFGDGSVDSNITANKTLAHNFTVAKYYTVKLTVSGPGGTDSTSKQVFVYVLGADPIQMSGSYASPQKVTVTFSNFINIQTPSAQVTVDSVGVWYLKGAYPQTPATSTYLKSYTVATLKSLGTSTYTDMLTVPVLAAPDSIYGFMNGIFWSDGKISVFDSGNGTRVLMRDTFPIVSDFLVLSGRYVPDTTALVFLDNVNQIDTSRVDSVLLWYSLTGDTNPDFTDKNFTTRLGAKTVAAAGVSDTFPIYNALFNNEERTITAAVVLVGHNTKRSAVKKTSFVVGKKRPANPIQLHALALSSNTIRLTWNSLTGSGVERIKIWYRTGSAVPLQYDFSSLKLDSLVPQSVADMILTGSMFTNNTRYYFGAQVYANGLWSYVTAASSANDSTPSPNAPLTKNTTAVTSLVFDTSVNQIRVCWTADSTVLANGDSLPQLAIVYSTDSFPGSVGSTPQVVDIKGSSDCAYLKLREDLAFNSTYYVSLWLRASNSAWTAPSTAKGKASVLVPMYKWQNVLLFSKDYDTVYAFNRQLRFTNTPGDGSRVPNTVQVDSITPNGFTPLSIAFEFRVKDAGVPFNVGVKLSAIPAGYTAKDVRIFRQTSNGEWIVDTLPVYVDSGYAYELTNQLVMPFVAGVDTRRPSVQIITNVTDSVPSGVAIANTFLLSDNIANLRWHFECTKGGESYATGDVSQSGTLSDTSQQITATIPSRLVSQDNGVRAVLIVTDGTFWDTVDVSRRVVHDSALVWVEETWTPMSAVVSLDTSDASQVLLPLAGTTGTWKYDNTKFRIFRWGAAAASAAPPDKWVEYADSIKPAFSFVRGSLMWAKAKTKTLVRFGRGVTPSLAQLFTVTLPSQQWVDLALPFNFDITVADVMGATRDAMKTGDTLSVDSILICSWGKNTAGRYIGSPIFNNSIIDPQLNNAAQPLSPSDPSGFTFYNLGGSAVQLVIPPIPQAMSTRLAKKAALKKQEGWSVKITSTLGDGSSLSPVYCGYSKTATAATTYYPVSPSFGDASLGVFDRTTRRVFGHAMEHAMPDGGCAFLLAFCNDGKDRQKISCSLGNLSLLPKGYEATLYNDVTGSFENLSSGVSVEGESKSFRWLLVGTKEYLAKASVIARPAVLKLFGTYPNPFRSMVRIRYSLPYEGIDRVTFAIYDLRGRAVWRAEVAAASQYGASDLIWNGRSSDGRPVAAGMYILRMSALNTNRRPAGVFERKMTFMP